MLVHTVHSTHTLSVTNVIGKKITDRNQIFFFFNLWYSEYLNIKGVLLIILFMNKKKTIENFINIR